MRDVNRRSALIGTASLIGLGASRAFAQSQGVSQAPATAVAAQRAEHVKLAEACDTQFVGLPSATAPRSEVGGNPCQGIYWTPKGQRPRIALIATHYNVDFAEHYLAPYIASRGYGFLGWNTRYRGAEDLFTLEHALIDIGAGVKWLRDQGVEKLVILGNSGGGSLMGAYQAEATAPTLHAAMKGAAHDALAEPAEDRPLHFAQRACGAARSADQLARRLGDRRARSGRDRPVAQRVQQGERPALFRTTSSRAIAPRRKARNQRITDWCKAELKRLNAAGIPDFLFPLFRAWADLRFMDGRIDPSDRVTPGCYRGDPAVANRGFGLGRANTLKSWLSMWSLETSKCQGPEQLAKFALPSLVIQSRADQGVFLSDARKMFEAVGSKDKTIELIPGNHYLEDGPDYRHRAAAIIADWIKTRA